MKKFFVILSLVFCALTQRVYALNNGFKVALQIGGGKPITAKVSDVGGGLLRIEWSTLARDLVENDPYPVYKIRQRSGTIDFAPPSENTKPLHPTFWGSAYVRSLGLAPLLVSPAVLHLSGRKYAQWDWGFWDADSPLLRQVSPVMANKLAALADLAAAFDDPKRAVAWRRSERADAKEFFENFNRVTLISDGKLVVPGVRDDQSLAVKIFGNDWWKIVVNNEASNPLILSLDFFPEKAPESVREGMKFLRRNFSYHITRLDQ